MLTSSRIVLLASLGLGLLTGCPADDRAGPDAAPQCTAPGPTRKLDILFVIDDSGSMQQEQAALATHFPEFMQVLKSIEGGLPDVHIGVISSDMGTGGYPFADCHGLDGDGGALQNAPFIGDPACPVPRDKYISDTLSADGTTRVKNYDGTLEDTFACISRLGTLGCGFEQHLESMRRALDPANDTNTGFLREDAYLAVVFIADEDDCSAADTGLFDPDNGALGPPTSFRCTEFGVTCDEGDLIRTAGAYTNCRPRVSSPNMRDPQEYVDFLKSLKCDQSRIIVSGIIGDVSPVTVALDTSGRPNLQPSCENATTGMASPGIRLRYVLDQFPNRSTVTSICNADLSPALVQLAELLADVVGP
jgi:hypothetical protein